MLGLGFPELDCHGACSRPRSSKSGWEMAGWVKNDQSGGSERTVPHLQPGKASEGLPSQQPNDKFRTPPTKPTAHKWAGALPGDQRRLGHSLQFHVHPQPPTSQSYKGHTFPHRPRLQPREKSWERGLSAKWIYFIIKRLVTS